MSISKRFSLALKHVMGEKIREGKKYTQTDLAKSIKASQTNISKYLTGKRKPSVRLIENVCNIHGISPDYIISGKGEIKKSEVNNLEQQVNSLEYRVRKLELLMSAEKYRPHTKAEEHRRAKT